MFSFIVKEVVDKHQDTNMVCWSDLFFKVSISTLTLRNTLNVISDDDKSVMSAIKVNQWKTFQQETKKRPQKKGAAGKSKNGC